jgi:2,3-bisphosphoglycerate-independent phosphoglycerate mutase
MYTQFFRKYIQPAQTKIILLILDGLGGLPLEPGGKTELETADTPNLDALAAKSELGLTQPVGPGMTVGSGPGHLAIFGYDPIEFEIGRGALEALGVNFELGPDDLAARGNFCTVDQNGLLTDRRAGRLPTEISRKLADLLRTIRLEGAEYFIEPVKEHRFAFILRASGLDANLSESDPLKNNMPPLPVQAIQPEAAKAARLLNSFIEQAAGLLAGKSPANMITLRGFAKFPTVPQFNDIYKLRSAAIAINGMYRGVARLVGMQVLEVNGPTLSDEIDTLEKHWDAYDFFYLHFKKTDTTAEVGDFSGKVQAIEVVDQLLPRLLALQPDVLIVGGDHSTPSLLSAHSWHPVPLLMYSKQARPDGITEFGERACVRGGLGILPATMVMPIALANAGRVAKYGA